MSPQSSQEQREESQPGYETTEWELVRAIPNLATGEPINVGIIAADSDGVNRLHLGDYLPRVRALARNERLVEAVVKEVERLQQALQKGVQPRNLGHIIRIPQKSRVRKGDCTWPDRVVTELVPS